MNERIKFNVDWLSIRLDGLESPIDFCEEFEKLFPGVDVMVRPAGGINFYKKAYFIPAAGHSSILFCWNEDDNENYLKEHLSNVPHGLFVSVSGDGCRYLNSVKENGLLEFCNLCAKYDYHVTRVDVNCDFLDDSNSIVPLIQLWASQYYIDIEDKQYGLSCNMKKENLVNFNRVYDKVTKNICDNITVGQRDSRKGVMQLYNKRVEVENGRLSDIAKQTFEQYGVTDYWWRLEYRCKSFSPAVFENLLVNGIHAAFLCAMDCFGRFYINKYDASCCTLNETAYEWEEFRREINEYLVELGEDQIVEIVTQPYIPADATRTIRYSERMAVYLYKVMQLAALEPQWFKDILSEGRLRLFSNARNVPFRNQLLSDYGFDVDPVVSVTIPSLEQVSMDLAV